MSADIKAAMDRLLESSDGGYGPNGVVELAKPAVVEWAAKNGADEAGS